MKKSTGHSMASSLEIKATELTARISSLGAELQSLKDQHGRDLLWDGEPDVWRGRAPILFPVVGALSDGCYRLNDTIYPMAKHGFARNSTFEIVEHRADAASFRLAATDATREIYPFEFQLDIRYSIRAACLTVDAIIANLGAGNMPASFGFHPAFRWPLPYGQPREDHHLLFETSEPDPIRRIDAAGLLAPELHPTPVRGNRLTLRDDLFEDDALIFEKPRSRRVRYGASVGPHLDIQFADFKELGVWTKPGAGFVCIEPWQGFADPVGFDADIRDKPGIMVIAAGDTKRLKMRTSLIR